MAGLFSRLGFRRARTDFTARSADGMRVGTWDTPLAVVDSRGTVWPITGERETGWRVEWWVGADDRWYAPAVEAAVRQTRPGVGPVLETRMRVSGGDVVATTWAAQADGSAGPAVVVELANETPVPVAVAVTVQAAVGGRIRRLAVDGRRLIADGAPAVVVDRDPGRSALVDAGGDLWDEVTGGRAVIGLPNPIHCRIGAAAGAMIVPLPHRTAFRFAVPAGDLVDNPSAVLPSAERVAAGWVNRLEGAATVDLPDGIDAHRVLVDLVLAESSAAAVVEQARWGLAEEAVRRLVTGLSDTGSADAGLNRLQAAATLWALTRHPALFAGAATEALEGIVRAGGNDADARQAVADLADLFEALGDHTAAHDARAHSGVTSAGKAAAGAGSTDDGGSAAELRNLAERLVRPSTDGLDLLVAMPEAWLGQPIEVHGLATPLGRLSLAVRWHAERPALLWELEPHPLPRPEVNPAVLRVPRLDRAFSTTEPSGEALLAAPAGWVPSGAAPSIEGGSFD